MGGLPRAEKGGPVKDTPLSWGACVSSAGFSKLLICKFARKFVRMSLVLDVLKLMNCFYKVKMLTIFDLQMFST